MRTVGIRKRAILGIWGACALRSAGRNRVAPHAMMARNPPGLRGPKSKAAYDRQPFHRRGAGAPEALPQAHRFHPFLHACGVHHAARGRGGGHRRQHRRLRALRGVPAYRDWLLLRRPDGGHVHRARHQRSVHGAVLPARRPRDQIRDDGGRAHQHPPGDPAHHGRGRRRAGAHRRVPGVQRRQPRDRPRLGRAHGDRHRLRSGHPGASGRPRPQRRARVPEHARPSPTTSSPSS